MSQNKLPAKFLFNGQPLLTGPDKGFNEVAKARQSDDAAVLARSTDGNWLFVWSDSGDGWAHATTVTVTGDAGTLPTWPNPIKGYVFKPMATVSRATDLKNGPESAYETLVCIPPNTTVKILARSEDGHWVFVWSDHGDGWVPVSAVQTESDLQFLPTWTRPIAGAQYTPKGTVVPDHLNIHAGADWAYNAVAKTSKGKAVKVLARNEAGSWVFIWSDAGDGWVAAESVAFAGDVQKLAVWQTAMEGAEYGRS